MEQFDPNNPTPEQLEKHFSALHDSVNLINSIIESGDKKQENLDSVRRNFQHIEIMLGKEFISNDSRDKAVFTNSVAAGKEFVGE